jgi:hypothetical protein
MFTAPNNLGLATSNLKPAPRGIHHAVKTEKSNYFVVVHQNGSVHWPGNNKFFGNLAQAHQFFELLDKGLAPSAVQIAVDGQAAVLYGCVRCNAPAEVQDFFIYEDEWLIGEYEYVWYVMIDGVYISGTNAREVVEEFEWKVKNS